MGGRRVSRKKSSFAREPARHYSSGRRPAGRRSRATPRRASGRAAPPGSTRAAFAPGRAGRLAMMAITGYAVQEFFWGAPIAKSWGIFFPHVLGN